MTQCENRIEWHDTETGTRGHGNWTGCPLLGWVERMNAQFPTLNCVLVSRKVDKSMEGDVGAQL